MMHHRTFLRIGAAHISVLMLIYTLSGLVHPCCLGGGEHGGAGHDAPSGAIVESGAVHHQAPLEDLHGSHGDDSDEESTCEGMCGLCCESAQSLALPQQPVAPQVALAASSPAPSLGASVVLLPRSAFLLPFANGPPVTLSIG